MWLLILILFIALVSNSLELFYKPWVSLRLFSIFELLNLVAIITLAVLSFCYLIHDFKNQIKGYIIEKQNKKTYPQKLDIKNVQINSTDEFCQLTKKLGDIVDHDIFPKNIVIPIDYISEFSSLPDQVFHKDQADKQINQSVFTETKGFRFGVPIVRRLSQLFSGEYLENIVKADAANFDFYIKAYVKAFKFNRGKGITKIDDVTDFMIYILSKNAYNRVFGSKLLNQHKVMGIIANLTSVQSLENTSWLNFYKIARIFLKKFRSDKNLQLLSEIIGLELRNQTLAENKEGKFSLVQLLKKRHDLLDGSKVSSVTFAILHIFKTMIVISPTRLSNIITDISISPDILNLLTIEQSYIIKKYGKKINLPILNEMKILEKVIKKSLLNSSPASYINRKAKQDIVLSNGITLEKDSIASINMFSQYHPTINSKVRFKAYKGTSNHNKAAATKILDNRNFKLLWGSGNRSCPFAEYSLLQIKVIIAILVRRYEIFAHAHGVEQPHPGYQKIATVIPKSSTIFLKNKTQG